MANSKAGAPSGKLSFAKIAAAGLRAPSVPSTSINKALNAQKHTITSAPRDGTKTVYSSSSVSPQEPQVRPANAANLATTSPQEKGTNDPNRPEVRIYTAQDTSPRAQSEHTSSGLLAPVASEEVKDSATLDSSSSVSAKPPSLDGKSVASGTTFALDEKESLRPDDSASVKAVEDEEVFSPADSCPPDADTESDVRAFRDQLREISSMEPSRHELPGQGYSNGGNSSQGVLYVPPQGLDMGAVPAAGNGGVDADFGPHAKLLEALTVPQNRIWVLKLEQDVTDFVKDPKEPSLHLPQCNSYQRMLAHKIADYYRLGHVVDESNSSVRLFKTPYCRLPPSLTGIATPSTADSTPPPSAPQMKILRRGGDSTPAIANGSGLPSKSGSDDDTDNDSQKPKKPMSYEERVANYESVRLRIMGSAKPSETVEEPKANEASRSSSAAGKKSKKKQRSDSDEGFDTRSAYNTFLPAQQSSNSFASTSMSFTGYHDPGYGGNANPGSFNQQTSSAFQVYSQGQGSIPWAGATYSPNVGTQQWNSGQAAGYDLSNDFQRMMSFQTPAGPQPPTGFDGTYNQQLYSSPQPWQQHPYHAPFPPPTGQSPFASQERRPMSSGQYQDPQQPYAFGQLPSQTFPGRPPSKLEHPIPGSYKGKHFNPHSQSFIPGQQGISNGFRPYTPQGQMATPGFNSGYSMQRQHSSQSQASSFGSPHNNSGGPTLQMQLQQPMNHPLPQPVFPQQPSPSVPLPPKPGSTPQKHGGHQLTASPAGAAHENSPSSIAKWGAPASLPAKPPPPAEPFDPSRFPQVQRPPSYNTAASARIPNGAMPSFGSMPPMGGTGLRP
ncbi:hypothetical protein EJ03DRAFT_317741 [Teratosphaeria nubilosa]|uniref:R3H domain-containing protein n=1 Tax=Teratosphaeria nubilosa TaxID=161662 RepID=A0A6G1L0E7_9PEZI|nr:hypothetical protein EJ03DRAFT_317741 [Teratosphaeria nubilosa]